MMVRGEDGRGAEAGEDEVIAQVSDRASPIASA